MKLPALAAVAALLSVSAHAAEPPLLDLYYTPTGRLVPLDFPGGLDVKGNGLGGAGATVMVRACGS